VPVAGVVRHPVEQQPQVPGVAVGQEPVEGGEVAEGGIDGAVVADVVAEVGHGRPVDRRQPDGVHAQVDEVVEVVTDAGQVADAVPVGVGERTGINLIHDGITPPRHPVVLPRNGLKMTRRRVTPL
jgi:hypothetical protein